MKRNLVVTSSTIVRAFAGVDIDQAVTAATAGERKRLEAYLYGHSKLVAVVHEVEPYGQDKRVTQRALVTVEGPDAPAARFSADYQAGRLQSGSFGVIDYVEDELAAREHLGLVEEEPEETLAQALNAAADDLEREEVEYALGLDSDHVGEFTTVIENGVERPYTDADLQKDIDAHRRRVQLLREAAIILADR